MNITLVFIVYICKRLSSASYLMCEQRTLYAHVLLAATYVHTLTVMHICHTYSLNQGTRDEFQVTYTRRISVIICIV